MIFPRYHQLDAVRKLEAAARDGGRRAQLPDPALGRVSGKSNTHRLARPPPGEPARRRRTSKVFDSVVVVTDRRVLDKQLQDTIYQFEHKQGVVAEDRRGLARSSPRRWTSGTPIIITTLQKFPFVTEKIGKLPEAALRA